MQIRKNDFQNLARNFPTCHQSYVGHEFPPYLPLDSHPQNIYMTKLNYLFIYYFM
jgi:hypothetical protein